MHPDRTNAPPFPATPINQPSRCELVLPISLWVRDHVWMRQHKLRMLHTRYNRIFKKTAHITQFGWIRKFGAAYGTHSVEYGLRARRLRLCSANTKVFLKIEIPQHRRPHLR